MKFAQALFMNSSISSVQSEMPSFGLHQLWTQLAAAPGLSNLLKAIADRLNRSEAAELGPYSLVNLAHQGGLLKQGIPSQQTLVTAHRSGQMTAKRLVEGAVKANLIPKLVLRDAAYLDAVETGLWFHALAVE